MKKLLFAFAVAMLAIVGCEQKPEDDPNKKEDLSQYGDVYLTQASSNPNEVAIDEETTEVKVPVNIFLSGFKAAPSDITASFEVKNDVAAKFNETNGTACLAMPEGSYSIDKTKVTLKAESNKSDDAIITVDFAKLAKGTDYVLSVSLKECSFEKVDAEKTVAYFVFKVAKEKQVIKDKVVLSLGAKCNGTIDHGEGSDILFINADSGCDLFLYTAGEDGMYGEATQVGTGWFTPEGLPFDTMFCLDPGTIIFRDRDFLKEFGIFDHYTGFLPAYIYPGGGCAEWQKVFVYSNKCMFIVSAANELRFYQFYNVDTYDSNHWVLCVDDTPFAIDTENDWSVYKHLFCCGDKLLAVDGTGKMYAWDITADSTDRVMSIRLGKQKNMPGEWGKFEKFFECQGYIMAVDPEGNVHQIEVPEAE